MRYDLPSLPLLAALVIAGAACVDEIDAGQGRDRRTAEDPEDDGPNCNETYAGPSATRRLSRFEYDSTVRDLLGVTGSVASAFPPEEIFYGFDNHATDRGVSLELATQYMFAAEKLAAGVTLSKIVPCDPKAIEPAACARQFIATFGKRAYRRPLETAEVDSLMTTFDVGERAGFETGIRYVLQRMLQSPSFLYRVELAADAGGAKMIPVSSWELASRLSYFLWGSMPDDELFAAAESDALASKEKVAEQARRMLRDPRAREVIKKFHRGWLNLDAIDTLVKSSTAYPAYSDDMIPLMKAETERFAEDTVMDGKGDISALFTAPHTFVNDKLAPLYGVSGVTGPELRRVELDPTQRAGILTQVGFLSATAKANQTSPILRGKFVRTQLLCQKVPSPPPGVVIVVPDPKPGQTTRQRFAEHTKDPSCAGCHAMLDPVGFGFEHYDGIGRWRSEDEGPVDATGEVTASEIGKFNGAIELAKKLAESPDVEACVARQWFRYIAGRIETKEDKCTLQQLDARFKDANYNIQELLVALTQTDGFLYRAGDRQ